MYCLDQGRRRIGRVSLAESALLQMRHGEINFEYA